MKKAACGGSFSTWIFDLPFPHKVNNKKQCANQRDAPVPYLKILPA
jgi:hypothetical protein